MSMQSGFPFTINISGDTAGIGGGSGGILIRGNPVPGQSAELPADKRSAAGVVQHGRVRGAARPPVSALLGRNTLVGPGLFNIDTTLSKKFRITERYRRGDSRRSFQSDQHSPTTTRSAASSMRRTTA